MQVHPNQIDGIDSLRTQCNEYGAEDIEASENRNLALNWLYRLSGRTNCLYTGLWAEFQEKLKNSKSTL